MILLRVALFLLGAVVVTSTLISAVRTFVVPRGIPDHLTRIVFTSMRYLFHLRLEGARSYGTRDRIMAFYAPYSLLTLPAVWLALVLGGYTAMFWALDGHAWQTSLLTSGSSLLTLGFAASHNLATGFLAFSEAAIGLTLAALLIAYLPTMYAAFQRREAAVTLLETEAGSPPSAIEMLLRLHAIEQLERVRELWPGWQAWFADISESHTSLSALVFYRSPRPDRSWVTASGAVLDAASLVASTLALPRDPQAELCIRSGYLALRQIADLFQIEYDPDPHFPANPISITPQEFDQAYDRLEAAGIHLRPDRQQAWCDFAGWRVNYDTVLLALASLTVAPPAPWSADRALPWKRSLFGPRHVDALPAGRASTKERKS